MAAAYKERIQEILESSINSGHIHSLTAKGVRKQLENETGRDLTPIKKDLDALALELFDGLADGIPADDVDEPRNQACYVSKNPREAAKSTPPPPPKAFTPRPKVPKQVKSPDVVDDDDDSDMKGPETDNDDVSDKERDAKLARQLQALDKPTRPRRAAAPVPKRKLPSHSTKKYAKKRPNSGGLQAPVLLSPTLSELLDGVSILPRAKVTSLVWKYIKENGLQNPNNKIEVIPDEKLGKIIGSSPLHGFKMSTVLSKHMSKPDEVAAANYKLEHANDSVDEDSDVVVSDDDNVDSDGLEKTSLARKSKASSGGSSSRASKKKKGGGFNKPYQLSNPLSEVCRGLKVLSRPKVVKMLWKYIKKHDLQNPRDKREILCDDALKSIFANKKKVTSFSLNKYIGNHLGEVEDDDAVEDEIPDSDGGSDETNSISIK